MHKKRITTCFFILVIMVMACSRKADIDRVPQGNREVYNFNYAWHFMKGNPKYANKRDYNDSQWRIVSCPHSFNDEDTYDEYVLSFNDKDFKHWVGTVWYRKHFSLPKTSQDKKVYIEFESVHQDVEVFLNGFLLGKNKTAFIPFGYELTPYLKWDEDNVLAVKVSNDRGEYFKDSILSQESALIWQANLGGITSNVNLYVMDPLHITLPLYDNMRTSGAYVYTKHLDEHQAIIAADVQIENQYTSTKQIELETLVFGADGDLLAKTIDSKTIGAHEVRVFTNQLTLENPILWRLSAPYLYTVCHVIRENNCVIDRYSTPLGIRQFDYDQNLGLTINDSLCILKGWGQKTASSWAGLGNGLPDWIREYSFRMMDDMGANYIRWRHSSATPAEVKMADKYGFICRLPSFAGKYEDIVQSREMRINALRKLLIYYRNHPSVFIWDIGKLDNVETYSEQLLDLVLQYDPYGGRLLGNRRRRIENFGNDSQDLSDVDFFSEENSVSSSATQRKATVWNSPRRFWGTSEGLNNSIEIPSNYWWSKTDLLSSEDMALRHVKKWERKLETNPYAYKGVNGDFFDHYSVGHCPSEVANVTGVVDAVRLPKEAFFALKTVWRSEPQVHLLTHWNSTDDLNRTIYAVSNCEELELWVNDRVYTCPDSLRQGFVFQFPNVEYQTGYIQAKAYNQGHLCAVQQKETTGKPYRIKLTPITGPRAWQADGSDVALIDVEVLDKKGRRCELSNCKIDFEVSGPVVWRGGYNSGKENSINNLYLEVENGINRVALRSTLDDGQVIVMAHSKGLKSDRVVLHSKEIEMKHGVSPVFSQTYSQP